MNPNTLEMATTVNTTRALGVAQTHARPSRAPATIDIRSPRSTDTSSSVRMARSAASTARKLSALTAKHIPVPTAAISTPAIIGPITREALKSPELSATALGKLARADHLEGERLATGRVEDKGHATQGGQEVHERKRCHVEQRHHGEHDRHQHRRRLRRDHQPARVDAVGHDAGKQPEHREGEEAAEGERADGEWRTRELDHEPRERHVLHPAPGDRDDLACEEEPVVAVAPKATKRPCAGDRHARHGAS